MNVLNWIQQERKTADYHVIKWPTSHFHHPRSRTDIVANVAVKPRETGAAASGAQPRTEGIGFGPLDNIRDNRYKSGGFGTDGQMDAGLKVAADNKVMSTPRKTQGNQTTGPEATTVVVQTLLPTEVYSIVESARQVGLKVKSRIKQSAAKLKGGFQEQAGITSNIPKSKNAPRRQPEKEQRGTRHVTKDEVLSMQAENHYLLDSYDKNGQYSMLGK